MDKMINVLKVTRGNKVFFTLYDEEEAVRLEKKYPDAELEIVMLHEKNYYDVPATNESMEFFEL